MIEATEDQQPRRTARYTVGLVAFAAVTLFLLWVASDAVLLIFAGILFAAFLDGLSRLLDKVLPFGHGVRLGIVCTLLGALILAGAIWGSMAIAAQADTFITTIRQQFDAILEWLQARGVPAPDEPLQAAQGGTEPATMPATDASSVRSILPNLQGVFGTAWTAVAVVFGVVGNAVVILFLGIFFAAQPVLYRDAALLLIPPERRAHVRGVLNESGEMLRQWLLGQAVTMSVIFVFTWLGLWLVGVQPAFALGLQAGLLAFIPNIGPLIAGIFIVLASLGGGLSAVVGAMAVYLAAQTLESYLLTPMIQQRAIEVPPAFLFAAQIVLGFLFGFYGLALATPLAAIARVFILRFYVEDTLGDQTHHAPRDGGA